MPQKVVVIASVLKPPDDTRLYEKLGISISQSNKYRVNIIGFGTKKPRPAPGVTFHYIYGGSRLRWARLLAPWKLLGKLFKLKPQWVIVCTPELLTAAAFYKMWSGCRLWYDVQENYILNIKYQSVYHPLLKPLLIALTWTVQGITRPLVERYLLAERCYAHELSFIKGKYLVLENKFKPLKLPPPRPMAGAIHLIFSGTLSRETGVMQALSLVEALHGHGFPVRLTVVGHAPQPAMLQEIKERLDDGMSQYTKLVGGADPVPHQLLMEAVRQAHFGLVAHQPNPSSQNCIPTKIYEYLGLRLPFLLQHHPLWMALARSYPAAVTLDFCHYDPRKIWQEMQTTKYYVTEPGPEITWEWESQKLMPLL